MIAKAKIRKLEKPLIIGYFVILLLTYLIGRNVLEMYTTDIPSGVIWTVGIAMAPFIIYGTLRSTITDGGKWYGYISYFIGFSLGLIVSGTFLVMKCDLLLSTALIPMSRQQVSVLKVEKAFRRKIGFDHTEVTLMLDKQPVKMEARPNTFFLLENKKSIFVTYRKSFSGNYFVTDLHLQYGERWQARWIYLKDWAHRIWYVPAFFIAVGIAMWISACYFPPKSGTKPKPIMFWRLMAIVMGTVMAIGLLLYIGLLIYLKFFIHA
jgi:hypothetical protein